MYHGQSVRLDVGSGFNLGGGDGQKVGSDSRWSEAPLSDTFFFIRYDILFFRYDMISIRYFGLRNDPFVSRDLLLDNLSF